MRARKKIQRFGVILRCQLSRAQESARCRRAISQPLGEFRDGNMALAIFHIKLRDAHKTGQRFFSFIAEFKGHRCGHELLDGFLGPVLFL